MPTDASLVIFALFLGIGVYLLMFRTAKAQRHWDTTYATIAAIFGLSCLTISVVNGSVVNDIRGASYPLYFFFATPIAVGVMLVRDPLRQLVIGVRASLVVIGFWALADLAAGGARFGMGSNAANAAFAIAFLAILSRLQIKDAPRLLSHRHVFFYISLIPISASQTRAVLPVFLIGFLLDLFNLLRRDINGSRLAARYNSIIWISLLGFVAVCSWTLSPRYAERLLYTAQEFTDYYNSVEVSTAPGVILRATQWRAALDLIAEYPLLGRGGAGLSEAIIERSPPQYHEALRTFTYVHNFVLDEILQRGLLGLALTIGFFGFCFARTYNRGNASTKENVILMIVLSFSFGMLHYLLTIDRHVALYALYFTFLTASNRSWRPPTQKGSASNE